MNKFNTSKNTFNKKIISKELEAYSNEIGNNINRAKEKEEKRRKRDQKLLGAGAITLALGTGFNHFLPANTETEPANNHETGVHSIDVSDFDTYESPADGDNIAVTISEGGRIRSEPRVTGKFDEPNTLYKAENDERYEINIDYEFSEQQKIPVLRHDDGRNPEWIGLAIETLPEETQDKLGRDSDGIAWVNQQKANVYIGHSEEGPTQTKLG